MTWDTGYFPLETFKKTVESSYKTKLRSLLQEIGDFKNDNTSNILQTFRQIGTTTLNLISLLIMVVLSTTLKYIKAKLQKQFDGVEDEVNKLSDILILDESSF